MDVMLGVIAEPTRRRMLDLLAGGALPAGEIERRLGVSQPMASRHLRVLRQAGLVSVEKRAQQRIYRLTPAPMVELDAWLARFRPFWAAALDGLADHLKRES